MTENLTNIQLRKTARTAGLWYLIMTVMGIFTMIYIPSKIIVAGNTEATVNNILANESLYRFGIICDLLSLIPFIITVFYLYRLFKEVNINLAKIMFAFVIASVVVTLPFEMINLAVLMLLGGSGYLAAFSQAQLHSMAMFLINLNQQGVNAFLNDFFFGLWLLPFAYLVYKSKFIPKIFGILLLINGIAYIGDSFVYVLFPLLHETVRQFTIFPIMIGEMAIMLWLLIIGVRIKK